MPKESRIHAFFTGLLRYLVATVSLSVILYIVFALIFSTDEERHLQRENRLMRERYARMLKQEELIGDVVDGLIEKDDAIYEELFATSAPSLDAITAADLIATSDSLSESFYLSAAASASESLMLMAGNVDENFAAIFRMFQTRSDSIPPLSLPLHDMSYVQTGASVGMKGNPLYKVPQQHNGLDLIAPQGAPVYAAAPGADAIPRRGNVVSHGVDCPKPRYRNSSIHDGVHFTGLRRFPQPPTRKMLAFLKNCGRMESAFFQTPSVSLVST